MAQRGALTDINRDDVKDFQRTWTAMDHMGLVDNEKMAIFGIIAGILHLGNISFEDDPSDKKGQLVYILFLLMILCLVNSMLQFLSVCCICTALF